MSPGFLVELSGENLPLARAELDGAADALGGRAVDPEATPPTLVPVELPDLDAARRLADRLGLARRVIERAPERADEAEDWIEGLGPGSASFRPVGTPTGRGAPGTVDRWVAAWKRSGGTVDLARPARRFYFLDGEGGARLLGAEVAAVDRARLERRRMPTLPYRRPVSLLPKLARAAVNLARVRPGQLVVDPFVGTGALLAEAAAIGAKVAGIDRDAEMVRGAARNLEHLGLDAERLLTRDAGEASGAFDEHSVDAIVTDPPYGRASASGGEVPAELVRRVLSAWANRVRPGGRIVVVLPGGADPAPPGWVRTVSLPDRVHRSLTREFRVYERGPATVPVSSR